MFSPDLGLTAFSKHATLPEELRCNGPAFCLALFSICFLNFDRSVCNQRLHCIPHELKTRNETHILQRVTKMQCCRVAVHIRAALLHAIKPCTHYLACNFLARNQCPPIRGSHRQTMNPEQPMPGITLETCQETKLKA